MKDVFIWWYKMGYRLLYLLVVDVFVVGVDIVVKNFDRDDRLYFENKI